MLNPESYWKGRAGLWTAVIAVLIILETSFILFFRTREYPRVWNEIGLFLTSLTIGAAVMIRYWGRDVVYRPVIRERNLMLRIIPTAGLLAGMLVFAALASRLFRYTAIDPAISDIIPLVRVAVQRMLNGEQVYRTVTDWGELPVTYLPLVWLPYSLAEVAGFDYRWIAVAIFCMAALTAVVRSNRISGKYGIIVAAMMLFSGWMILQHEPGILTMTIELMIAGYYMFFIMSMGARGPWIKGFAIGLCLLSRYSLVLWLPLWAFVELVAGNRKEWLRTSGVILIMVVLIYVVPFLSKDWTAFGTGYQHYTKAAVGEWNHLNIEGKPAHLYLGIGFARWYYEY
jgi:hypothetical protein